MKQPTYEEIEVFLMSDAEDGYELDWDWGSDEYVIDLVNGINDLVEDTETEGYSEIGDKVDGEKAFKILKGMI